MRTEKQHRKLYEYILLWAEKMGFGKLPTATHLGFKKPLKKKLFSRFQIQKHQTQILSSLSKIQAQQEWGTSPLHKKRHTNCIGSRTIASKQAWFWENKITTSFTVGFLEGLQDLQESTIS
jgi:hypothetical protein